jgi:NAD(P)-dependent dehydrogenase (short-subunit alcohol dehydrogenase family)
MRLSGHQNKIALVTRGAAGIGRGVCQLLAEQGANVYAADINEEGLLAVVTFTTTISGLLCKSITSNCDTPDLPRQ